MYILPSLNTNSIEALNPNDLRHSQYVTRLPMTKCAYVDHDAFSILADRWVELVTSIESQTHKSYVLGVNTLHSLFTIKLWPVEHVKLYTARLVNGT